MFKDFNKKMSICHICIYLITDTDENFLHTKKSRKIVCYNERLCTRYALGKLKIFTICIVFYGFGICI